MPHSVLVRLTDKQSDAVNEWRRRQLDPPSRAQAVRLLMQVGLDTEMTKAPEPPKTRKK